jgi:WD40 repeat protein
LVWNSNGAAIAGISTTCLLYWNVRAALHGNRDAGSIRQFDTPVCRIAFRPNGNILAVVNIQGGVDLWRAAKNGKVLRFADLGAALTHLAWSTSGKQLAVATSSGQVYAARVCK